MATVTLEFPEGMIKNATPYRRRGRWEDGNLVRWWNGSVRPIGGWNRRTASGTDIASLITTPSAEAVRDIFAWRSLDQDQNTVFGSNLALYHMSSAGVITDITYAGYTPVNASKDASTIAGYGQNPYGSGAYGAGNNLEGAEPNPPDRWYFDNFGEILLTGVRGNGALHELDLSGLTLSAVANAPTPIQDICVTEQRHVMAIGGGGQPRRVQTSEVEARTNWTPADDNQSIDRTIPGTGRLLRCVKVLKQILILGENDCHIARWIGPPFVFAIDEVGTDCGPLAPEALAVTDTLAAWWGDNVFYMYDGRMQPMACDVMDFLSEDVNFNQRSKIQAFTISVFNEIWWLYQSNDSTTGEVDSYVMWNHVTKKWTTGRLDRTAGIDKGVLSDSVMVASTGEIYNHELEDVQPDGSVFVTSGILETNKGEREMAVRYVFGDAESTDDVTFEFFARKFPNSNDIAYGPFTYNNPTPTTKVIGRQIRMKVNLLNPMAEWGVGRLDVAPIGTGGR